MARLRSVLALLPFIAVRAEANATLQGTATLDVGWTDAVGSGAASVVGGNLGPSGDFFGEVRPGLVFSYGSSRFVQRLGYTFSGLAYLQSGWSYSNRIDWAAVAEPTSTTTLRLGLVASEGSLSALLTQTDSSAMAVGSLPTGNTTFITIGADQGFAWLPTPRWRLYESAAFNLFVPIVPLGPRNYFLDPGLELDHLWKSDSLGGEVRAGYALYDATLDASGNVVTPSQAEVITRAMLRWRHDFGHFFASELGGGVIEVMRASDGGGRIWGPAALAALRYAHPSGVAELSYSYGVQPNALSGQSFEAHLLSMRALLPLGQTSGFHLSASGGYQHGSQIDVNLGATTSHLDLVLADASLLYTPREELTLFVRYQLIYQLGDAADAVPEPTYARNTIMVGLTGRYPNAPSVIVSRGSSRVDGLGASGIPGPHSELGPVP